MRGESLQYIFDQRDNSTQTQTLTHDAIEGGNTSTKC